MTEKLYYTDSHLGEFDAVVTACAERGRGCAVTLDRTAFFPEGGGQPADGGYIGSARVLDVQEENGSVTHYTDAPLPVGGRVACKLDMETRLRRMQSHSGEHIVSAFAHSLYGLKNVGFHMGGECMTIDFDGELSAEQLERIETLANETVRRNLPVRAYFPDADELAGLSYRSKLDLKENVRLVEIGDVDLCACCAPHVAATGEIGLIKLLSAQRHRGGVRVELVCGMDALEDYRRKQNNAAAVSCALSVKRDDIAEAVRRLLDEQTRLKAREAELGMDCARLRAAAVEPSEGNICVFDTLLDEPAQRELVNLLGEKCAVAALFSGTDGDYRYIIGSRRVDLRAYAREINAAIKGKGGGTPEMLRGRAGETAENIQNFLNKFLFRQ